MSIAVTRLLKITGFSMHSASCAHRGIMTTHLTLTQACRIDTSYTNLHAHTLSLLKWSITVNVSVMQIYNDLAVGVGGKKSIHVEM